MAVTTGAPAISNTFMTTGANLPTNIREDLADYVWQISPETTPVVTAIGRGKDAQQIKSEWLVQELQPADVNVQPEGFRYAAQAAKPTTRIFNECQIMFRSVTVSNTLRQSNTVGGDEWDRQMLLKGVEVRRDLEYCVTRASVRSGADPRQMSGLQCYISNGSMGAGTGAMPTGDGSNAPVAGTGRTLILDMIASAMQGAFTQGGHPGLGAMSPRLKRAFSALAQGGVGNPVIAQNIIQSTQPAPVEIVGAVDAYLTDFGRIEMAPDIFMPDGVILLVDKEYAEIAPLTGRDMISETYGKVGDAMDGGVVFEGTLRVNAPKAHAMVGDLS